MRKPVIGVLTWREGRRFAEPAYFRRLIGEGRRLGAVVFLFSPQDVDRTGRRVRGFVPGERGNWKARWFPWPDIVIDRYRYYPKQKHRAYLPFRKQNLFLYANNRLANKWKVHQVLWEDEEMRRWLPETLEYSRENLRTMLQCHPLLYVKPSNGSGGRGILRVERAGGSYVLLGRGSQSGRKRTVLRSTEAVCHYVDRWVEKEKWGRECFVVQQGLRIELLPRRAVDLRLLIQKDGTGTWAVTGLGVRAGKAESAASNLHAGGKAAAALPFLTTVFGAERAQAVLSECHALAHNTARAIERNFGRMMELGLDIGVDTEGRVWLIEVNPKPGRDIFRHLGEGNLYREAVRRPIQYALYLLESTGKLRPAS